jgi:hypothetical protein
MLTMSLAQLLHKLWTEPTLPCMRVVVFTACALV